MQGSDTSAASDGERGSAPPNRRRRVALAPHETEIAGWVAEGRSDEWIASALGTSPASIQSFRSRKGIFRPDKRETETHEPPERLEKAARTAPVSLYEGTLEHGEEGYGLWLDPAVADDPIFERGFGKIADVEVSIGEDRIVLTPAPGSRTEAPEAPDEPAEDCASRLEMPSGARASQAAPEPGRERGRVRWYDPDQGYGFIYRPDGQEIFFHRTGIKGAGTPQAGAEVSYEATENERGPIAKEVRELG